MIQCVRFKALIVDVNGIEHFMYLLEYVMLKVYMAILDALPGCILIMGDHTICLNLIVRDLLT